MCLHSLVLVKSSKHLIIAVNGIERFFIFPNIDLYPNELELKGD